jgi:hypothetical protein
MRRLAIFAIAVAWLATCRPASAQVSRDLVSEEELEILTERVDTFFKSFRSTATGPKQALRDFVGGSPLEAREEEMTKLVENAERLKVTYGEVSGHEPVAQKNFGKDLVVLKYLLKAEKFPIVWHFYFYRGGNNGMLISGRQWKLIELRFDTDLKALER